MTTYAIEILDLGFVLTLGAWWAALMLVALATTALRHATARGAARVPTSQFGSVARMHRGA